MAMGFRGPGVLQTLGGMQQPDLPFVMQPGADAQTQAPALPNVMSNLDGMQAGQGFAPSKPKLFGDGGKGWMALGLIGDALQSASGGQATYAPMAMDMQQQAQKERAQLNQIMAQAAQKRQERNDAFGYHVMEHDYDANNPGPTTLQRDYEYFKSLPGNNGMTIGEFMGMYRPQYLQNADGTHTQVSGIGANAPDTLPSNFDFGGGGVSNGTGGFRR